MVIVQTISQLADLYQVEPIGPFGLMVTARKHRVLGRLAGGLLEDLLRQTSLLILRGFDPTDREGFLNFCLSYPKAELLHWESGPVMEMIPETEAKNYLFSREAVPFHWDGAFHRVPSFLAFHCLKAPAPEAGGETLFTDTTRLWEAATPSEHLAWASVRLTYRTEKLAHYGGAFTTEMVQRHPWSGERILRFAEPVTTQLNPVSVEVSGLAPERAGEFLEEMGARLHAPEFCYAHRWEDGDYVIADNHSLVHGRNAFIDDSPRHLRRIQIL